jgi:hypothetical protein
MGAAVVTTILNPISELAEVTVGNLIWGRNREEPDAATVGVLDIMLLPALVVHVTVVEVGTLAVGTAADGLANCANQLPYETTGGSGK